MSPMLNIPAVMVVYILQINTIKQNNVFKKTSFSSAANKFGVKFHLIFPACALEIKLCVDCQPRLRLTLSDQSL